VESRIVAHRGSAWHLEHGPFEAAAFTRPGPWTLLVQRVDQLLPAVASLLELVRPIPRWRIDDVMASYATDGGSVGPHYDNYDVFLLQGSGRRRWLVGDWCPVDAALLPHPELRLLADFRAREEHLLEPGDVLYLPPRIAHWGIAEGECTTFSIGLRAPRVNDMVARWVDRLLEELDPELFYRDLHLEPARRAGEIRARDLERARLQVQAALDQMQDGRWFGELVTAAADTADSEPLSFAGELAQLRAGARRLCLSPGARLAWQYEEDGIAVFANGVSTGAAHAVEEPLQILCAGGALGGAELAGLLAASDGPRLIEELLQLGVVDVE
jgi:50S ribosomal protein L16 3-hydroxylase